MLKDAQSLEMVGFLDVGSAFTDGLDPQVGSSGAPVGMGHFARMYNILSAADVPAFLVQHVFLRGSENERLVVPSGIGE
jgi:hypothetical protein